MSPRVLLRIVAGLVLLVIAWRALALLQRPGAETVAGLPLPRVTEPELVKVHLVDEGDSVVVTRAGDAWWVNGFPASGQAVRGFLAALNDSLSQSELVSESAQSHERLGVDSLHARRMVLSSTAGPVLDLWLGRRGPDFEGFYVRRAGAAATYLLRGAFAEATALTLEQWRDRQIARVPPESVGSIEVTRGRSRWSLTRGTSAWNLAAGPADSARAVRFLFQFGDVRAAGFPDASGPTPDFSQVERTVTVRNRAGEPLLGLALDSTEAGAFWVRRERDSLVFRVDGRLAELLTPAESSLRP